MKHMHIISQEPTISIVGKISQMRLIISIIFAAALTLFSFRPPSHETPVSLDRSAAQAAFEYLNEFRSDPAGYGSEIGLSLGGLNPRPELHWNEALAKAAEAKAMDMAENNYFSHRDSKGRGMNIMIHKAGYKLPREFRQDKSDNYFESICANAEDGIDFINILIIDEGVPSLGHRNHLLGIDRGYPHNALCTDIGIGFVRTVNEGNEFETYACVLIAFRGQETGIRE